MYLANKYNNMVEAQRQKYGAHILEITWIRSGYRLEKHLLFHFLVGGKETCVDSVSEDFKFGEVRALMGEEEECRRRGEGTTRNLIFES